MGGSVDFDTRVMGTPVMHEVIEIPDDVVFEGVVKRGCCGMRDVPDRDGVSVGRRFRHPRHAERAAGAADVFDQHRLAEGAAHRLRNEAGHGVGRPAGCGRNDQRDRLGRKGGLRRGGVRREGGNGGEGTGQDRATIEPHWSLPSNLSAG